MAASEQSQLVQALVLRFLVPDVLADNLLVSSHRGNEVAARPEMLAYEIALSLAKRAGDMDRALPLEVSNGLRHRVLGRDRNQDVHVVGHEMPLLDAALLLLRKLSEHGTKVASQGPVERLPAALGDENHVVLAFPLRVAEALIVVQGTPFRESFSGLHGGELPTTTPGNVKQWMPPRQSRGVSRLR